MTLSTRFAPAILLGTLLSTVAAAHEDGTWILRAGVGNVAPDNPTLDLSADADTVVVVVDVDDGTSLVLSATYMFTRNWAFDILAAYPFSHDINLVVNGESAKVASTDHLPPTFSVQYHFLPDASFQPYVGVGLNWTTFFSTDTVEDLANQGVGLSLDDSFGIAAQFGGDILLGDHWVLNADVRWINIESDANLGGEDVGTVKIDPWVYAVNVGYRF